MSCLASVRNSTLNTPSLIAPPGPICNRSDSTMPALAMLPIRSPNSGRDLFGSPDICRFAGLLPHINDGMNRWPGCAAMMDPSEPPAGSFRGDQLERLHGVDRPIGTLNGPLQIGVHAARLQELAHLG